MDDTEATVRLTTVARTGGTVATLTVDNARKINVLSPDVSAAFAARIGELGAIADLRAVVVTGAGPRAFIGGADIGAMATFEPDSARNFITGLHRICDGIRSLPVPVIARINGYCLGAGLEIAAACDMRVAVPAAVFAMPEVRVGIPSVIEAALLPGLIGWGRTRELLPTGRSVDAAEAMTMGLVERIAEPDALDGAVEDWLDAILASGPNALALQKQLITAWETLPLDRAIAAGIDAFALAYEGDEPARMMDAFLNRPR